MKKSPSRAPSSAACLPAELQRAVVGAALQGGVAEVLRSWDPDFPDRKDLRALVRRVGVMACACRDFADVLGDSHPAWAELVAALGGRAAGDPGGEMGGDRCAEWAAAQVREGKLAARRAAMLIGYLGCEACGAPRVRKVHWPIAVRCCAPCFEKGTVTEHRLTTECGLPADHAALRDVPYARGPCAERRYWTDAMLPVLRDFHGLPEGDATTLAHVAAHVRRRRHAQALEAAARVEAHRARVGALLRAEVARRWGDGVPYSIERLRARSPTFACAYADALLVPPWATDEGIVHAVGMDDRGRAFQVVVEVASRERGDAVVRWFRELKAEQQAERDWGLTDGDWAAVRHWCVVTVGRLCAEGEGIVANKRWFRANVWPGALEELELLAAQNAAVREARAARSEAIRALREGTWSEWGEGR